VRFRTLLTAGLTFSSFAIGIGAASASSNSQPTVSPATAVTQPSAVVAAPKPVSAMKPMPAGATAKDFQKAAAAYALSTGQTYGVDSAAFDPTNPVRPQQSLAPDEIPPDVPGAFTYLDLKECRDKPEGGFDPISGYPGKIVNHYQWCGWQYATMAWYKIDPHGMPDVAATLQFRVTMIGWGSSNESKISAEIYVDRIRPFGGILGLTEANTTLTFRPYCQDLFGGGTCDMTSPAPSATVAALKAGTVLHMSATVGLPAASEGNPDRITGFNFSIQSEGATTAAPGDLSTAPGAVSPAIRCDGATASGRGGFTTPACIFIGALSQWQLSKSDSAVGEVAQHIEQAQTNPGSTEPQVDHTKVFPDLLHRTVDKPTRDANRAIATGTCDVLWGTPRPTGMDCDEFPFASTQEGAANTSDTFDYSVKLVTSTVNRKEGALRGAWYRADRILGGDPFTVAVS
jgi:hypothetical protein